MSDSESYTDELFDGENASISDAETVITSPDLSRDDDPNVERVVECDDVDIGDLTQLFGGNALPPEYYQGTIEDFDDGKYKKRNYSDGTKQLKLLCEDLWREFCAAFLKRDPQECFESIHEESSIRLPYKFLEWRLNQKVGRDGRRLKGVKKFSSLVTYWKIFCIAFKDAVGEKLDPQLGLRMQNGLMELATKYGLSFDKRMNWCMSIDDLKDQNQTTIATTEKSFILGEMRVLAVLYTLLLSPAGSRPMSILKMTFGDLSFAKARDPEGGAHQILIRFSLRFTKTWLGPKATKTHPLPEHFLGSSFLLSTHVFLLGLMFHHRAFRAPDLISPEQLDFLDIHSGDRELSLPLKHDIQDTFLFRKIIKTATGYEMSAEQLPYSVIHRMLQLIGQILGRECPTISYSLRYNTGNALDRDPHVSDSLRNVILGHQSSTVFQSHYLTREIAVDTSGIVQGLQPKQAMMIQATSLGHSASKRRPRHLTTKQREKIKSHPTVVRLQKVVLQHERGSEEHSKAIKDLTNVKLRLENEEKQKMLDEWTAEQAVDDIQRQLNGMGFKPPAEDTASTPQGIEQKRFTEALNVPPSKKVEEYFPQRNEAISAIMAYCRVYEGPPSRRRRAKPVGPIQQANDVGLEIDTLRDVVLKSVMVDDAVKRPRKCFVCVGNALRPNSLDSGFSTLTADFYSPSDLNKHFRRFHLQNLQEDQTIECPACSGVLLEHKQEFMAHAQVVHGIHLRAGNSYETDSRENNANIGCDNDRRSRKREAESSILVAPDNSRKSGNSADHADQNSHSTNKRQKLEHATIGEKMSASRRRRCVAGYFPATAKANKRNYTASASDMDDRNGRSSMRQRLEPAIRGEEGSGSRRTKHFAGYSSVSTEANKRYCTASTNGADDKTGRPSKRQKPTSYFASKVAPSDYEGEKRSPVAPGNGSFSGVPRASTFENPNRREWTAVRPRARLLRRKSSPAGTKPQTDVASDGDRTKTVRQYQPFVRFSDQSSDDNSNSRNRTSQTPMYANPCYHGAAPREKQRAMRTPAGHRIEAAPKSIPRNARGAATDHHKMPDLIQAKGGRTRVAFTDEQNMLLRQLKGQRLSWKEIHKCFTDKYPGRSQNTLQVHYSTKLSSGTK